MCPDVCGSGHASSAWAREAGDCTRVRAQRRAKSSHAEKDSSMSSPRRETEGGRVCAEALQAAACSAHGARGFLRIAPANEKEATDEDRCPDECQSDVAAGTCSQKGAEVRHTPRRSRCLGDRGLHELSRAAPASHQEIGGQRGRIRLVDRGRVHAQAFLGPNPFSSTHRCVVGTRLEMCLHEYPGPADCFASNRGVRRTTAHSGKSRATTYGSRRRGCSAPPGGLRSFAASFTMGRCRRGQGRPASGPQRRKPLYRRAQQERFGRAR